MTMKVKAIEKKLKFTKNENDPGVWRYVMSPEQYSSLNQKKVIKEAALRSGTMRFGLRSKSVEDVNKVKTGLITSRRIIFTPDVDLKDELKNTAIVITCYDRDGKEVKRVTSADDAEVEDDSNANPNVNPNPNDNGNDNGNANQGGDDSQGGNTGGLTPNPGGSDEG